MLAAAHVDDIVAQFVPIVDQRRGKVIDLLQGFVSAVDRRILLADLILECRTSWLSPTLIGCVHRCVICVSVH